ncbi:hypothetical protein PGT21_006990 [Puccinia graminis f. sp. tritici]|uniref:Uncharacterized protein n=1 Tax=Puccinia graminis f. sp. tritici TaxID=56615 RepID=A0A5B0MWU0_PUCGR|nr:hypothetical protein PGTUg99_027642 [Puccinia graminis f. sp. tritici]KAA1081501.1 hypothetical protein PGTUg99_007431 [Puccinia graminis f. sp. tritici]KAA1103997.1 hypothetical protein PGT21_006990 [Puccinia graminis f. sp. tritici]
MRPSQSIKAITQVCLYSTLSEGGCQRVFDIGFEDGSKLLQYRGFRVMNRSSTRSSHIKMYRPA